MTIIVYLVFSAPFCSGQLHLPDSFGRRYPPPSLQRQQKASRLQQSCCSLGKIAAGPATAIQPLLGGSYLQSWFIVPPLPEYFDLTMTYYNYFNIYFDPIYKAQGALYNQFVPQLMLGTALGNSTGPPHYDPIWVEMTEWHFGAQYFMGLLNMTSNDDNDDWIPKAATGELYKVQPDEVLLTNISLSLDGTVWTLNMSVVGDDTRISTVVVPKPFMGLLESSTSSWKEYSGAIAGSVWENYGMVNASSYPPWWHQVHDFFVLPKTSNYSSWYEPPNDGNCSHYSVVSHIETKVEESPTNDQQQQTTVWNMEIEEGALQENVDKIAKKT